METLSITMICKDEESCIERCLESIKEADEIILVDTGSTDKTLEIASKYSNVKIFSGSDFTWRDDFAFSRNQSLERCTGTWCYVIDCDEYLEPDGIAKIKKEIAKAGDKLGFLVSCYDDGSNDHFSHYSVRLFKNYKEIKWHGAIHNYLSYTTEDKIPIKHYIGYSAAHAKDPGRALRILQKVCKENPTLTREFYYLAREYWYRNDYKLAIYYWEDYLKRSTFMPEIVDAYMMLAYCYRNTGDMSKAREMCLKCIDYNTNFKEALNFMVDVTGPGNSKRWKEWAKTANNDGLLFVRT